MFTEGPPSVKTEAVSAHESESENVMDPSVFLGKGFNKEFFADKLQTFEYRKTFDGWNAFLLSEEEDLHDRLIEMDAFTSLVDRITGKSASPLMFPVFVQAVKAYCENESVPDGHITPDRMERFYQLMASASLDT